MAREVLIGSDFTPQLRGVQDAAAGTYLNSATVTFQLYLTATGAAVSGASGTCSYVAASDGVYRGTIDAVTTAALTAGAAYHLIYTGTQGGYDFTVREDVVARSPGSVIIDPAYWMSRSGITVTGADLVTVEEICEEVSSALMSMCDPIQIVPLALTLAAFDAPPHNELHLPRPIRSVSAIYVRPGANGDSSTLTAADLLTNFTDYYSPVTNKRKNWNGAGIVYRRGSSVWGVERLRPLDKLGTTADPNRGAVFVSGSFGPASVDPAVKGAAFAAVTLLYNSRQTGGQVQSQSWNGGSFSLASSVTAEAALNAPDVREALQRAGVLPVHVG